MQRWRNVNLAFIVAVGLGLTSTAHADNMQLTGALVYAPCTLRPGDEAITLDFSEIIDRSLYLYTRTAGKPFALHLQGCDPTLANTVSATFNGTESQALPGLLALDGGSTAAGVAIGMETPDGAPLPFNQTAGSIPLQKGDMTLNYQSYVEAEPDAIAHQTIRPGTFTATATFVLAYQ
ncbi:fimbrial protein [Enterobacter cloacae]|uniref:fimbrial protein n=1 Tax=Enterobacter cloacae TaxID=550 RepID=UPI0034A38B6C